VGATGLGNVGARSVNPPVLGGSRISKRGEVCRPERKWSS